MSHVTGTATTAAHAPGAPSRLGAGEAVRTVVGMELRQRLRSRGWFILLAVFFALVGLVTLGALGLHGLAQADSPSVDAAQRESSLRLAGQMLFDGVLMFVLTLCLLVSPALAANAISGDRAGGTLAITQVTLLQTWHLMAGKWLAAWIASAAFLVASLPWLVVAAVVGHVDPLYVVVGLATILVEFGVITGIGVAVSAIAGRTLFAVVVTYLLVALLSIGTLIGFLLSLQFINTTVRANEPQFGYQSVERDGTGMPLDAPVEEGGLATNPSDDPVWDNVADSCAGPLRDQVVPDPRRTGWMLAANPYVVLADASPWRPVPAPSSSTPETSALNLLSGGARWTQRDPLTQVECLDGQLRGIDSIRMPDREGTRPMWPWGLAMQGVLTAGLLWWGHRRLDTPAGRLAAGTRVA